MGSNPTSSTFSLFFLGPHAIKLPGDSLERNFVLCLFIVLSESSVVLQIGSLTHTIIASSWRVTMNMCFRSGEIVVYIGLFNYVWSIDEYVLYICIFLLVGRGKLRYLFKRILCFPWRGKHKICPYPVRTMLMCLLIEDMRRDLSCLLLLIHLVFSCYYIY